MHTNEGVLSLKSSSPAPVASRAVPPASRIQPASWLNLRSSLGLILIFGAALAGTVVLQRAQQLVPVYAAARDLPSGVPLANGDLSLVRVHLPGAQLGRYLRPGQARTVAGKVLTAPLRRHMLVPTDALATSLDRGDMVEFAIEVDHGDMPRGLRPGDHVRILGAYPDGLRNRAARVLVESAEIVRILEDPGGLAATRRESGVQVRLPAERTPSLAAAIVGGRVFILKAPSLSTGPAVEGAVRGDPWPAGPSEPEPREGPR